MWLFSLRPNRCVITILIILCSSLFLCTIVIQDYFLCVPLVFVYYVPIGHALIRYSNLGSAVYAKEKLNGFEYPPGNRLAVNFVDDGEDHSRYPFLTHI